MGQVAEVAGTLTAGSTADSFPSSSVEQHTTASIEAGRGPLVYENLELAR